MSQKLKNDNQLCSTCNGDGTIYTVKRGIAVEEVCPTCHGKQIKDAFKDYYTTHLRQNNEHSDTDVGYKPFDDITS